MESSHAPTLYIEDLEEGLSASINRTISAADVEQFAALSGDTNPVHLDDDYAASTNFGARIVHGMFSAALISAVAGTKLPGPGAVYLDQSLKFRRPIYLGDEVEATLTVSAIDTRRNRVTMKTLVSCNGKPAVTGEATYMVPNRPGA